MSILLPECACPDTDQLILFRIQYIFRTLKYPTHNIFCLVFAHIKTGKFSVRLQKGLVSTKILVQNLTIGGTEKNHMQISASLKVHIKIKIDKISSRRICTDNENSSWNDTEKKINSCLTLLHAF